MTTIFLDTFSDTVPVDANQRPPDIGNDYGSPEFLSGYAVNGFGIAEQSPGTFGELFALIEFDTTRVFYEIEMQNPGFGFMLLGVNGDANIILRFQTLVSPYDSVELYALDYERVGGIYQPPPVITGDPITLLASSFRKYRFESYDRKTWQITVDGIKCYTLVSEVVLNPVHFLLKTSGNQSGFPTALTRIELGSPPRLIPLPGLNDGEGSVELADVQNDPIVTGSATQALKIETPDNAFPEELSKWFSGSKVFSPVDIAETATFESGDLRRRPIYRTAPQIVSATVEYDQNEYDLFASWFEDTFKAGSTKFYVQTAAQGGDALVWYEAILLGQYTVKVKNAACYEVALQLLISGDALTTKPVPSIRV